MFLFPPVNDFSFMLLFSFHIEWGVNLVIHSLMVNHQLFLHQNTCFYFLRKEILIAIYRKCCFICFEQV